jgi:hypothetical protein
MIIYLCDDRDTILVTTTVDGLGVTTFAGAGTEGVTIRTALTPSRV